MIHDDLIVYRPPTKVQIAEGYDSKADQTWNPQLVNYRYARLCSTIIMTLYSHASLKMSPSESMASLRRLSTMLNTWKQSIPDVYRPHNEVDLTVWPAPPQDCCIQSELELKHAEASFAIHRWAIMELSVDEDITASYNTSRNECIATAKVVLLSTQAYRVHEPEMDWYVHSYQIP